MKEERRALAVFVAQDLAHEYDMVTSHQLVLIDLPMQVPQIEEVIRYTSLEVLNRGNIRLYLSHHPEFDLANTDKHVFFIETLIHAMMRRFVREAPEFISPEELVDQLRDSIMAYLEGQRVSEGVGGRSSS